MKVCTRCGKRQSLCACDQQARPFGTRLYQRAKAQMLAEESVCWICENPPWPDDINPATGAYDPITADHIVEVAAGGSSHRDNLRMAHRSCNSRRGQQFQEVA